ncbi:MAG: prepilin peptidase [Mycobacteriaceae bacterium]
MAVIATTAFVLWGTALSVIDLRVRRLPNYLTIPGAVVILVLCVSSGYGRAAIVGAAALSGLYLLFYLGFPSALGAGDIKLALGLGALTGRYGGQVWLYSAFTAIVLTAVCGAIVMFLRAAAGKPWRSTTVPHGPSMCLASAVFTFFVAF